MLPENTKTQPIRLKFPRLSPLFRSDFLQKIIAGLGSRAIVIVLGFTTAAFVARQLGPEGRGLLGVANTITALGVQLGLLGFNRANIFHVSKNSSLLSVMITNSLLISCLVGGLVMLLLFFFHHTLLGIEPLPLPLLTLSLAIIPFNICFLLFQSLLSGVQNFKHHNLNEILLKSVSTFLILTIISMGTLTVLNATLFQGVAITACLVWTFRTFSKSINGIKAPSLFHIKNNFFYGGKSYLVSFFTLGIKRVDVFFLQRSQGFEQVGYFSVALSIIDILFLFSIVIAAILYPKLCAESDIRKKWELTKKTALYSTIIILFTALVVMLWSTPILWIFGVQFAPVHMILVYLLPGFILLSIQHIMLQFIASIGFPRRLVFIWVIALGIKLVAGSGLIPQMGVKGVAISWTVVYLFIFISLSISIKSIIKKLKNNPESKTS
ncbi:MAG: hypothetical protein K1060chlam2_00032 [Chlamydiae bacterium]|nr:hypothetical protein [Chlamydiota bacterium]